MKNFTCSKERWRNYTENMLELAQGNLSKKLIINHLNDDFESLEALLNWINDEWKQRILQMTFTKPSESQKFINHFQMILDNRLHIKDTDELFPRFVQVAPETLYNHKITNFIKSTEHKAFLQYLDYLKANETVSVETPSVTILNVPFLYSIKTLGSGEGYLLNLFQIHLDTKYFQKGLSKEPGEIVRLEQKKRYRDLVEEVKSKIDQMALSENLLLKPLCKELGLNTFQLKKGFQELYQSTPYHYFLILRMKHAYLLIETDTISLKEISQKVGYSHYPTFSNQFCKLYSISPRQLRNGNRQAYLSDKHEQIAQTGRNTVF